MFMSRTGELQDRFRQIEASMKRLSDGATEVRLAKCRMSYLASIVNFEYLPCPISSHRSAGPVANVEVLLPGNMTF